MNISRPRIQNGVISIQTKFGWGRWWLPVAGAAILTLSFAAMSIIWKSIQDMEAKRFSEQDELAQRIGETAATFLDKLQYADFKQVLGLLQRSSFINQVKVRVEGRTVISSDLQGPARPEARSGIAANIFSRTRQVRNILTYQNGKQAELQITFSLDEFLRPKLFILVAFAVIMVLLVCLGLAGYWLYRTHQKLVSAEHTKKHMIYGITHDAKQDLSVIQGKISSLLPKLKKGSPPANLENDLHLTMESADAIERYLNNLKDQEHLAEGRVEILREAIGLQDIIASAAGAFAEKMNIRNMAIKIGHLENGRRVLADPLVVKRVLLNLLHNAMKYSPAGGVVSIWQEARQDCQLTCVRDQGQGIAAKDWQRIFEPYVQLDTKNDGMGLGLATARSLVELMGGRLEVTESVLGQGTVMCLALPWVEKE